VAMSTVQSEDVRWPPAEARAVALIMVVVIDKNGASIFNVPDPRTDPSVWPWTGLEEEKD
jgi:hypothetical protein